MDEKELRPPRKNLADKTHEYGRDVAKAVTLGLANPLVDFILPSFHQKRFDEWCENIFKALMELSDEKISFKDLQHNEEFISLLKESMVIASKTHQKEKHEFLRRTLLNQLESPYSFDEKIIFTRLIDSLTLAHMYLLHLLFKYSEEIKEINKFDEIVEILETDKFSEYIPTKRYKLLIDDLAAQGLVEISEDIEFEQMVRQQTPLSAGGENHELPYIYITETGSDFIKYIMNA